MADEKSKAEQEAAEKAKADKAAADKARADENAADKAREARPKVKFYAAGGRPGGVEAFIVNRATNDVNVVELELRDGKRIQSVPRWHGKGEHPGFDVWVE